MNDLFQTIHGKEHSTVHSRIWRHRGAIVDAGCAGWDFTRPFFDTHRVIGIDPDETSPQPNVEFFRGLLGPINGWCQLSTEGQDSTVLHPGDSPRRADMVTWDLLKQWFHLHEIALLKINIEGGEWPLLMSMNAEDLRRIDQIAVSFHEFRWPQMAGATKAVVGYLADCGFEIVRTEGRCCWHLALRKE